MSSQIQDHLTMKMCIIEEPNPGSFEYEDVRNRRRESLVLPHTRAFLVSLR